MAVDVLLGLQWGDEGKGKIVDYLAKDYDMVARFQGGPNAGHTLVINGNKFVLHTVPSGIFLDKPINLIGNGVVIDPTTLLKELDMVKSQGIDISKKLFVSNKAHLIMPSHKVLDAASEAAKGKNKIGSTLRGIGPTYMDKTGRNGLRVGDIFLPDFKARYQKLKDKHLKLLSIYDFDFDITEEEENWFKAIDIVKTMNVVDSAYFVNQYISANKKILAEGAQGSLLDIEHGTYPFVTSSHTTTTGVCSGLGIAPQHIGDVIGIFKAYVTRVGSGPFPTELLDDVGEEIRKAGHEFGATTGRPRRCGWLDMPALKYAVMINGVTKLAMTKSDVLDEFEALQVATAYGFNGAQSDELPYDMDAQEITPVLKTFSGWQAKYNSKAEMPKQLKEYVAYIEEATKTPISYLSYGPGREELMEL